jgi:hypothetical protein
VEVSQVAEHIQRAVDVLWVAGRGWPMSEPGICPGAGECSFIVVSEFSSTVPQRRFLVTVTELPPG